MKSKAPELAEVEEVDLAPLVAEGERSGRGWPLILMVGVGLGAAAMYLLDPHAGNRRRAFVRDKLTRYTRIAREKGGDMLKDLQNRSTGLQARLRAQLELATPSDDVLAERVRSRLGHVITHSNAIEVSAHEGRVTLRGPVLAREVDRALMAVRLIPGVTELDNQLQTHATLEGVTGL